MVIHVTHRRNNRGTDIHIQVAQKIIILFFFSYWRIHIIWRPGEERYVTNQKISTILRCRNRVTANESSRQFLEQPFCFLIAHLWLRDMSCGQKFKMEGIQRFDGGEFTLDWHFRWRENVFHILILE